MNFRRATALTLLAAVLVLNGWALVNLLIVKLGWLGNTGGLFTSVTVTAKLFVELKGGNALSVTIVVSVFVLGPCASVGVQVMMPFVSILAPLGGATRV